MRRQFIRNNNGLAEIRDLPLEDMLEKVDILVLGAHNDDEMFPAGYLLNRIKEGKKIGVVVATDGLGSNNKSVRDQELIRTEESRKAIEALGGTFFIGCGYPSSYLRSEDGLKSFSEELVGILELTHPKRMLTHSPLEGHYTHLMVTEAAITAVKRSQHKPEEILGYEVWTPLSGLQFTKQELLNNETVQKKLALQSIYSTENKANAYQLSTQALNLYNFVMANTHKGAGVGYAEIYLDMTRLVNDKRFCNVSAAQYGGGIVLLSQIVRSSPNIGLTREQLIDKLIDYCTPLYMKVDIEICAAKK